MNLFTQLKNWLEAPWPAALNADRVFIQVGHILGGYAIVFTAFHFYPHLWLGLLLTEAWALPKEFWFDIKYEKATIRGSSLLDFLMYQVGAVLVALVLR